MFDKVETDQKFRFGILENNLLEHSDDGWLFLTVWPGGQRRVTWKLREII